MRIELNKLDAAGLEGGEGVALMEELVEEAPVLPEKAGVHHDEGTDYNPGIGLRPRQNDPFSFPDFSDAFPFNDPFDSQKEYHGSFNSPSLTHLDDDLYSGYSPPLKLKPHYHPTPEPYAPAPYEPAPYEPAPYAPAPAPYVPPHTPDYHPDPYAPPPKPDYHAVDPYHPAPKPDYHPAEPAGYGPPPKPAYEKPVGPVLLEKRPYEVKSVQPVPITVAEGYSKFDCRSVPYPDRHYADPETGCQVRYFFSALKLYTFFGTAMSLKVKLFFVLSWSFCNILFIHVIMIISI